MLRLFWLDPRHGLPKGQPSSGTNYTLHSVGQQPHEGCADICNRYGSLVARQIQALVDVLIKH